MFNVTKTDLFVSIETRLDKGDSYNMTHSINYFIHVGATTMRFVTTVPATLEESMKTNQIVSTDGLDLCNL